MLLNAREMRGELRMPSDQSFPAFTCDDVRRIQAPMLLVKGENSPVFLRTILDKLHACVPAALKSRYPLPPTECNSKTHRHSMTRCSNFSRMWKKRCNKTRKLLQLVLGNTR